MCGGGGGLKQCGQNSEAESSWLKGHEGLSQPSWLIYDEAFFSFQNQNASTSKTVGLAPVKWATGEAEAGGRLDRRNGEEERRLDFGSRKHPFHSQHSAKRPFRVDAAIFIAWPEPAHLSR